MKEKKELEQTPTKIEIELPRWAVDRVKKESKELACQDLNEYFLYFIRRYCPS